MGSTVVMVMAALSHSQKSRMQMTKPPTSGGFVVPWCARGASQWVQSCLRRIATTAPNTMKDAMNIMPHSDKVGIDVVLAAAADNSFEE